MKNKSFFYQQYNKIKWENQEKTKINFNLYEYLISKIIRKEKKDEIKILDIGIGNGAFIKKLGYSLIKNSRKIFLEGCEPSKKNYDFFMSKKINLDKKINMKVINKTFLDFQSKNKFDFISAIYVFPHFLSEELNYVVAKIYSLLEDKGKFILVVAEENYIKNKLKSEKDLFIEENAVLLKGRKYKEVLHYSDIPEIGKIIDFNREEKFYLELFQNNKFKLNKKIKFNDSGFIATIFIFEK